MIPFALPPIDAGYRNQILGAFEAINSLTGSTKTPDEMFILPENISNYMDIKTPLYYSQFNNYEKFKQILFKRLDLFMAKTPVVPHIFVTAYNPTESSMPGKDADKLCAAIKEYYKKHNLGNVLTVVLTSHYYKYKYVDLVNIPKHLMTFSLRIRLLRNKNLRKKILITVGTINNFNIQNVKNKFVELKDRLKKLKADNELQEIISTQIKRLFFCWEDV